MLTRRGFFGLGAAFAGLWATATQAFGEKRGRLPEWSVHEDAVLAKVRELLDPFRGQFLLDPKGGRAQWAVTYAPRSHRFFALHVDVLEPIDKLSGRFLLKTILFTSRELFRSKPPQAGIRRRLQAFDKKPWREVGLYELDVYEYEDDGAFEYPRHSEVNS